MDKLRMKTLPEDRLSDVIAMIDEFKALALEMVGRTGSDKVNIQRLDEVDAAITYALVSFIRLEFHARGIAPEKIEELIKLKTEMFEQVLRDEFEV